jgi:amidase
MKDILLKDAIGQRNSIKSGEIKATELVQASIDAIEQFNPSINAVINKLYDRAHLQLDTLDKTAPFYGVPILLKDGIACVKGETFSNGSNMLKSYVAEYDSELVKRLEKAGFIIVGKTNMPEFGLLPTTEPQAFGPTKNPWNLSKTAGGSSGGSAAAVAARLVAVAHGNDGGGSIRIPSSCCGLFGLKPSRGRIPLAPLSSLVGGLVEEHVLTRSVRDSAAILDILSVDDPYSFHKAPYFVGSYADKINHKPEALHIGYSLTTPFGSPIAQDCQDAVMKTVEMCKSLGHKVEQKDLDIPFTGKELGELFNVLWSVGATTALAIFEDKTGQLPPGHLVEPLSLALYKNAKKVTGPQYELTLQKMHKIARAIQKFCGQFDLWINGSLAQAPVDLGVMKQDSKQPMKPFGLASEFAPMTALFNVSGQPAASVPVHWNTQGLPIGVQIAGNNGDEFTILQLSAQLEKLVNWEQKLPSLIEF